MNALRFFIPAASTESLIKVISKIKEKNVTKDSYYEIKLEWDGKNVSKYILPEGDTYEFTYDDMMNPFHGLFASREHNWEGDLSENNITKIISRHWDQYDEDRLIYTYIGKFPSTQYNASTTTDGNHRYTNTFTYYYEYK